MTITVVFDPPLPSDSPATFNTKAFAALGDLNDWSAEANSLQADVNSKQASASTSATNAANSASAASTSASAAATSATNASTSASTATTQATNASTSASAASTSATNAANSASAASTSASAAATSAAEAESATAAYWNAVSEFAAVGDGSTDDATAFANACASGAPVYVPKVATFYALASLTEVNRTLLWGPGVVKVGGVEIPIASTPGVPSNTRPAAYLRRRTLAPTNNTTNGSVGLGISSVNTLRTGGYGQYGNQLSQYQVDAALPSAQFDVNDTSWITLTNLTGGTGFARWAGGNTPAKNLGQTYTSGSVVGDEINVGNRWANFGLLLDLGGTRETVGQQIVPDVLPSEDGLNTVTCTMSAGTPGLVNLTAHGYTANMGVVFGGGGTLPTELTAGTVYYVSATGLTTNAFAVSATLGGTAINFAGASSGTVNVLPSYPGNFAQAIGRSIWGHQWWVGRITRANTICAGGIGTLDCGGLVASAAPAAWAQVRDYWTKGLDFTNATFGTTIALQLKAEHSIYFGAASIAGGGTGHFSMSTGGTGNLGALYADNYSVAPLQWKKVSGAAALGFFGTAPVVRTSGFGTPTNGAIQPSFDANTITHADLAKAFAHWVNYFNSLGLTAI